MLDSFKSKARLNQDVYFLDGFLAKGLEGRIIKSLLHII